MKTRSLFSALCLLTSVLCPLALAQAVSQPELDQLATTGTVAAVTSERQLPIENRESKIENPSDDVVQLSVFNVTGMRDDGYAAANTASGSRINTPLQNVAATISPFTEDFLTDIGAESIEEVLNYAPNVEREFGDSSVEFESDWTRMAGANNNNLFRARGIGATTLLNGGATSIPIDNYNVERMELSLGANSILFGIGAQGGVLAMSTKRANVNRNTLQIKNVSGIWSSSPVNGFPTNRNTLDYNLVLIPRKMAFRLNALYLNNKNWRYWEYMDDKRLAPSFTAKPFKNTTIAIAYEGGRRIDSPTRMFNIQNAYSTWDAAGRPIMADFVTGNTSQPLDTNGNPIPGPNNGINIINPDNQTINYYAYVNNDNTVYNYVHAWQTVQDGANTYLLDPYTSPWSYSNVGPGAQRSQKFDSWFATIEQRFGNLSFELGYFHNQNDSYSIMPNSSRANLRGDPNLYISPPTYGDATMANRILNPHKGQLYLEDQWAKDTNWQKNDTIRLTATYQFNFKNLGRHNIIAYVEHLNSELLKGTYTEILLDDNQRGPNNARPDHSSNRFFRRQYITEGDYATYYQGSPAKPVTGIIAGNMDRAFHTAWCLQQSNAAHIKKTINSGMIALQSTMLKSRLNTILGLRVDDASYDQEWPLTRISTTTDPRYYKVLNKTKAWNEFDFNNTWRSGNYKPFTFSAGGVYHLPILWNRFSLTANYSTNRGLPELDGRSNLPDGGVPVLSKGTTFDWGVRFDVFGNGKLTGRITHFNTRQIQAAVITPNGVSNNYSNALGGTNLYNIYDALFFLRPTGLGTDNYGQPPSAYTLALVDGQVKNTANHPGPMTQDQYAVIPPTPPLEDGTPTYPYGMPPVYNCAYVDTASKGWEFELNGQITKNLSVRFNLAYTDRARVNMMKEILDFYNTNIPVWMAMADPYNNGGHGPDGTGYAYMVNITGLKRAPAGPNAAFPNVITMTDPVNQTQAVLMPLQDFIWNQLYAANGNVLSSNAQNNTTSSLRNGLASQMNTQTGALGSSPWKGIITVTYKFPNKSYLKGLAASASCRYESGRLMPDPNRATAVYTIPDMNDPKNWQKLDFDPNFYYNSANMISGQTWLFYDCMLRYKMKILGGRANLGFQLNITNLFNKHDPLIGRMSGDYVTRYYLPTPRQIRLTTTIDF